MCKEIICWLGQLVFWVSSFFQLYIDGQILIIEYKTNLERDTLKIHNGSIDYLNVYSDDMEDLTDENNIAWRG